MSVIQIQNLTKDYGQSRGIFNISFTIEKGETVGFLGPNGAGKTTTLRHLLGFIRPDHGTVQIQGLDCFEHAAAITRKVGYLPGEISLINELTALDFITFMARLKGIQDLRLAHELMEYFDLQADGKILRMSKGTKQKIGLVVAMMQDPEILILDEPTSGLDPLMQNRFIELIRKKKQEGTTILLSSHMFEEVERTCDRAIIIRSGRIAAMEEMQKLRQNRPKTYIIDFGCEQDAASFQKNHAKAIKEGRQVSLSISGSPQELIQELSGLFIEDLSVQPQSLEELFMHFYGEHDHE